MANREDAPKTEPTSEPTGTGWIDRPEAPDVRAALVDRIGMQQRAIAERCRELQGRIDRGQHQKRLLAAFGTLRFFDAIPPAAKHAPFDRPLAYKAACRFSNGQPCPFSDQAADVRGIAIKFFTEDGIETDLLMTNEGGRSHARNAEQFMEFADILVSQITDGAIGLFQTLTAQLIARRLGPLEAARILHVLTKETVFRRVESLSTESYWGSVVKLGAAAIKYSIRPDPSTARGTLADAQGDNFLRQDLQNRLAAGPIKYQLCIQFFVDETSTPVNDASVAWRTPLVQIGELEIQAPPADDDEKLINRMAFNPGHGFEPLGITHARKEVYSASARARADPPLSSDEARSLLVAGP